MQTQAKEETPVLLFTYYDMGNKKYFNNLLSTNFRHMYFELNFQAQK